LTGFILTILRMPAAPAAPVSPISERQFSLPDEAATVAFGERFAAALRVDGPAGRRMQGLHVHLLGDLGAGKTTLVRATLHALGHRGRVRSPTYTLVEPYRIQTGGDDRGGQRASGHGSEQSSEHDRQQDRDHGGDHPGEHGGKHAGEHAGEYDGRHTEEQSREHGYDVFHFDLYRFADPAEWADAGFREYFNEGALCLVEWPQKAGTLIGVPDLSLSLDLAGDGRVLTARAYSARGKEYLDRC
jgi:tRNA threonylcarbamoyladenosine biosynthesis protein TsaE